MVLIQQTLKYTFDTACCKPAVQQSSRSNHFQNKEEAFVVGTEITFLHLFWRYCLFALTATYLVCQSTCCGSKNGVKPILKLHFNFFILVHNDFFYIYCVKVYKINIWNFFFSARIQMAWFYKNSNKTYIMIIFFWVKLKIVE